MADKNTPSASEPQATTTITTTQTQRPSITQYARAWGGIYVNVLGYKVDAAGISAAWSGLYLILAGRRKQPFMKKWGVRGTVRGAAMAVGFANLVGGGMVYMLGTREDEEDSTS
ncbi:hypothetical protein FQN57_005835 [Myotisia sp. PD_48]|nr:hypothetical protein FQN57_005835 [Myotisia sp. PD_48]